ncbi:Serine/threonine-protein kinase Nek1 [Durusdinium trenchii]|uniref:Serine/threonine-protein kinase Nek1 n=1 Tax=Durusdinium trenchii TaxID=1381693 RepID=A0ABP0SAH1_9DINO
MRSVLPPLPSLVKEGPQVRRAALLARVTARSSALAGLDDLDRKKREVALAAVTANGIALQWAPERFKNDKEVVLAAVANSGQALKYVGKALQSDRDVVSAAIQQNGLALHFASPRMRCDKELVLEACERDGSALLFAAERLREDADCQDTAAMATHSVQGSANSSIHSASSARSRFVASTRDGRWPSLRHWSHQPFLAASTSRTVGESEKRSSTKGML